MNKIAKGYIEELKKVYEEHLKEKAKSREELYSEKLTDLYILAFELIPEELKLSLRDEGSHRKKTLNYLKGECDTLDRRGDIYPEDIETVEIRNEDNTRNIEYNIIGTIKNGVFQNIKELQKIDLQSGLNKQDCVLIKSPYHTIYIPKMAILMAAKCFRYLVTEEKYRELFKYMMYEYICKDLGGEPDPMYLKKLERIKSEMKTNFMMKIEEYKDRNIVSLNYFRHK